jgi:hypothetical protein
VDWYKSSIAAEEDLGETLSLLCMTKTANSGKIVGKETGRVSSEVSKDFLSL